MSIHIIAFTARGAALAGRLCGLLAGCEARAPERYCREPVQPMEGSLAAWTAARFQKGNALVFVGAAGIAVRAVAPHVARKDADPAVLCMDEAGRHVVPLLSGHLGGANRLARRIAEITGGSAVLTTATDVNGVFSPDTWAAEHDCAVTDTVAVKYVSAALLDGETVGLRTEFPVATPLPPGISETEGTRCGIEISLKPKSPFAHTLHLVPRCIVAGMGCRRGVAAEALERRLRDALDALELPLAAVGTVASIDRKADEPGLLELCRRIGARFVTYTAEELMAVEGDFTPSRRVEETTGADNVCERAAVRAGGTLLSRKNCGDGVTVALARLPREISF